MLSHLSSAREQRDVLLQQGDKPANASPGMASVTTNIVITGQYCNNGQYCNKNDQYCNNGQYCNKNGQYCNNPTLPIL